MTQLLELHGVVEAPPDAVAARLLDVAHPSAAAGGDDRFEVVRDGSRLTVTVDRAAREITEQSEWWFRSTTTVGPDPYGSRVVHRIFNVAEGNGRAIQFLARGPVNAAPAWFAETIRRLGEQLGVPARVVD